MYASAKRLITLLAVWLLALVSVSLSAALQAPLRQCNLPLGDKPFATATPEEVGLSADEVAAALAYANLHGRFAVHIFRNNCLVGRVDALTDNIPVQIFSVTKSITASWTLTVGDYLPEAPSWGDAAHRAILVRQILTETSGTQEAILSELLTVGIDSSAVLEVHGPPLVAVEKNLFRGFYSMSPAKASKRNPEGKSIIACVMLEFSSS
ncbi:unnamed protein product [Clonostachys rhizophaga]|uniref:Beta-lactamase-related domain-containing protein n=1 Tax=Clonostachys rhizophaga TaxID=160324 RepID=A0A9N9VLG8_9HYPO|nr:unnamed protein product [Clonostachys rhizophaga]